MATLVKICGITNKEDALAAAEFGVDLLGFVFSESPRQIEVNRAAEIVASLPPTVSTVGLFVNETEIVVEMIQDQMRLNYLQFHGDEDPDYCKRLKNERKVIKAFRIRDEASLVDIAKYDVDLYLLDAYAADARGGTGATFNWDLAIKAKEHGKPIILAGGLTPENVEDAIRKVRPYAVDVSSGIEASPGKKDHKLMEEFIRKAKSGKL